jgi:hypothetical protein
MAISRSSWLRIQACVERQRDAARRLGEAVREREEKFRQVLAECPAGQPDRFRIGQIFYEYVKAEKFFLALVDRLVAEQRVLGTRAMEELGIDVAGGEYTVAEGGVVLRLSGGRWEAMAHLARHLH